MTIHARMITFELDHVGSKLPQHGFFATCILFLKPCQFVFTEAKLMLFILAEVLKVIIKVVCS